MFIFDYRIILYIIFGILPSLIWLAYYLSKDLHPEPKKTILRIFLWGVLSTIPVFFVQEGLTVLLSKININPIITAIVYWFLIISLSEEFFKYLVVRIKIKNSPDLDEPLDVMLYMVISALGFSALENILYLFNPASTLSFTQLIQQTLFLSLIRFLGATFLHTLCSAVVGYFLAISFYDSKRSKRYVALGLFCATLLHGIFDFSIMNVAGYNVLIVPVIILLTIGFLTFVGFDKLKKMKSISKIN